MKNIIKSQNPAEFLEKSRMFPEILRGVIWPRGELRGDGPRQQEENTQGRLHLILVRNFMDLSI